MPPNRHRVKWQRGSLPPQIWSLYPSSITLGAPGSEILVERSLRDLPGERDRRGKTLTGQSFRVTDEPNLTEEGY
jgi:hypothetical protein